MSQLEESQELKRTTLDHLYFSNIEHQLERIDNYNSDKSTLQLLEEYKPTEDEVEHHKNMLEFIKEPTAFERSNLYGHFTGSAWVSTIDGKRVLITHHKKLKKKLQLGGHADGDTDILRVALKETLEESGISHIAFIPDIFDVDVHTIPARENIPEHKHYDVRFLILVNNDSEFAISDESDKLEWITKDFDCDGCGYNFRRLFDKWKVIDFTSDDFKGKIKIF